MSSNRQLLAANMAKRADAYKIRLDQIHIEPGFNVPESPEEFDARVEGMVAHLAVGGKLPPIEVRDRVDGGVFVVEGHARREAYARAHMRGIPVASPDDGHVYVPTTPFEGNDADRIVRTVTSAEGRRLSPMQLANRYKLLQGLGWTTQQIARGVSKGEPHVGDMLALGNADTSVQNMVQAGEVSATTAAKLTRKHGSKTGAVLGQSLATAKAAGKRKVTAATLGEKRVNASELDAERIRLDWVVRRKAIFTHTAAGEVLVFQDDESWRSGVQDVRGAIDKAMAMEASEAAAIAGSTLELVLA